MSSAGPAEPEANAAIAAAAAVGQTHMHHPGKRGRSPMTPSESGAVAVAVAVAVSLSLSAEEVQRRQKKAASDIDDRSAAVYIRIDDGAAGASFCNGTLITYHSRLFVWTTAHTLVDTSHHSLPLLPGVELHLARDVKQLPLQFQRLAWTRACHTYSLFDFQGEAAALAAGGAVSLAIEEKRGFDVLLFELDDVHSHLADRARRAYLPEIGHPHDSVAGRTFRPSWMPSVPANQPVAENIDDRIQLRETHVPLGYMEHQAMHGSSGTGLIDRVGQLQGVIASTSFADIYGAARSILILPRAFTELWTAVLTNSPHVTTCVNPNSEVDRARAAAAVVPV